MLEKMKDESLCSVYIESFKKRPVKDRFTVSTLNLINVGSDPVTFSSDEEKEKIIAGKNGSGVNKKVFVLSSSAFSHYFPASEMYDRYVSAFEATFYSGWL